MEIELKLLIAPPDVPAFRRLALLKQFASGKPTARLLRDTYFDTPQLHLEAHAMEWRVRRSGRVWIQTLKAGHQVAAGLHQRQEWEAPVTGPLPAPESMISLVGAGSTQAKVIGAKAVAEGLNPIFHSEVRRTVWKLRLAEGAEVELALDQGELSQGDRREPISEIELELKAGAPDALFDLALQLQEQVPLRVGNFSKAERGRALRAPLTTAARTARPVALSTEMTVETGFRVIVGSCIVQMQDNEASVMQAADPESIHQMRVGMRRLRSALRLFSRWVLFPTAMRQELEWLGGVLGAARDAGVLADATLPKAIESCPQEPDLLPLRQSASTIAGKKRLQAMAAVASVRYSRLMLRLVGWLQAPRQSRSSDKPALEGLADPLKKQATRILRHRHAKLVELGERLSHGTPEERHRVRIAAKKARYATEFFESLYPGQRVKRYANGLEALQDTLGQLNDTAVGDQLLREIETSQPELARGASFARGYLRADTRRNLRRLGKLWKKFGSMKRPWV